MQRPSSGMLFGGMTLALLGLAITACSGGDEVEEPQPEGGAMTIEVTSPAFTEGASIPTRHTCDGEDVSPPLKWSRIPDGTRGIALVVDDPDAPGRTWVHWVLYGLPADVTELPEGISAAERTPQGTQQGTNDFKKLGYGGPCPPPGSPHRYFFKVYALGADVSLEPGATKRELLFAIEGQVLAQGQLMGRYQRQ